MVTRFDADDPIQKFMGEYNRKKSLRDLAIAQTTGSYNSKIDAAFGATPQPVEYISRSDKLKKKVSKVRQREAQTFLTATDITEEERMMMDAAMEQRLAIEPEAHRSIDEMLRDLDEFTENFKRDHDDLEELRRTIAATKKGIENHTRSYKTLKGSVDVLDEATKEFSNLDRTELKFTRSRSKTQQASTKALMPPRPGVSNKMLPGSSSKALALAKR